MSLTISVCDSRPAFDALRDAWTAMHAAASERSLFVTWEWLTNCLKHLSPDDDLRIVCVFDGTTLVGAAPLVLRKSRYYRVPVTELCFVGAPESDRQLFLDAAGGLATNELWRFLATNPFKADLIRLEQIPEQSVTAAAVADGLEKEVSGRLPYLPVAGSWSDYEATLSRKFRSEMRTRTKVFDSFGPWKVEHHRTGIAELLDALAEVEMTSAKFTKGYAFLADPRHLALLRGLSLVPNSSIEVVASTLTIRDRVSAYLLGFVFDNKYHAYNMSYLPEFGKGSPGKFLMHETIKMVFDAGLTTFDFLRGEFYAKDKWNPQVRQNCRMVMFYSGLVPTVMRTLVFTVRPMVKKWREKPTPPSQIESA